ncbi:ClpP/crotonase [Dendrothele bispora CBS 962.96]|uniref:ClpP/crotonase n=1 Tax=Dendrothele bispora (strain CBS 962.96) TaxID=1314807 RepID=A0A4S8M522_DENBC|nr:ClpP/crotonase [Dendrothele bispora CBS 962.96]
MTAGTIPQLPPHSSFVQVSFPEEHVLLLTLNRPKSLNAMTPEMTRDIDCLLTWFMDEPALWVAIVTGAGRIFCAGADLKAWNEHKKGGDASEQENVMGDGTGFASISRRAMSKPIIAAVNGGAYGGGMEIVLNCDLVVASEDAKFALPEVKQGVVAAQGGIPRLANIAGHQLAAEMLLTGRTVTAQEGYSRFGFINVVVPPSELLPTAVRLAQQINANSPDAIQSTKLGLLLSANRPYEKALEKHMWTKESSRVYRGENIKEGLKAFSEKRKAIWKNPAKL